MICQNPGCGNPLKPPRRLYCCLLCKQTHAGIRQRDRQRDALAIVHFMAENCPGALKSIKRRMEVEGPQ